MQDFSTLSDDELENIANGGADGGPSLDYAKMSDEELESIASGGAPQSVGNIGGRSFDDMSDDELEMIASGSPLPSEQPFEPVQPAQRPVGHIGMMTAPDDFANREAMGGATKASLQSQADLGVGAEAADDDGSVTNWVKNLWNGISANSTGKITARNTMKNAQELMRGTVNGVPLEDLPDEETDYLLDSSGANGVYNYFASFLPKSFRGNGSLMEEWDNGPGSRIEDPVERKRQRVAYAKSIAQGMVEQNEEAKRNAAMELKGRGKEWQADFTGGLVTNGAYMLPYMATLGMDKGIIAGVVEGLDRYNELRSDAYRVDDDGNLYVDAERDTAGKAALKATARGVMAPLIEKFGGELVTGAGGAILKNTIGRAPLVKDVGGKLMATAAGKALNRYVKTMHNFSKATGLHSFPEEVAEEFEDQVLDAAFGTDRRDSETNGTVLSRAGDSAVEFMKPENLLDLAKSMVLVQMIGGGTSHALDRRLARYTDGILTRVAGVDQDRLDGYTADEKAAALKAWWANQSEEDVVKDLGRGAKSVTDLLSAIRERAGNYDFSATDGVADEDRAFTVPTVIDANGQSVADFQDVTDDAGRAVKRLEDRQSGITIDAITQDDGTVAYKVRGRLGRVRSADTAEEARGIADQMAKRSARNDRKIDYLNTLREQGRALSGMDVVAGDTMREALDSFGNQYGEEEKRALMGGEEFKSGYQSNNPSLRFKLADGREGVLLNLGAIDSVGDMQNFATHEAVTHSGLDMVFSDPKMRTEFLKAVGSDADVDKDEFLSQIDKDAFCGVDKEMFNAAVLDQMRQRGYSSVDQVLADDVAREEVFAWVTERIHSNPSFKNKAVSALRKVYRRAFNADLKYNADELATMFDALRDMATGREGGSLRYRSVEQSAERDKASSGRDREAANAIRKDADSQPMQLENKQFSIEDGHRILMEMQGKAAGTVTGAKTVGEIPVQTQQNAPQIAPSETHENVPAKTADAPRVAQGVSATKPETPSFSDMSDADLGKYISDLKQFDLLDDFGRKNLADAEKEQRKRARAAEAEKRKAEAERKAKEKAEAKERQFQADNEQAFAEWLKRHPGRTDSKASRDDYVGDMGGAISSVVHSLGRGHGTKAPSTHLRAVLRRFSDSLSDKWKFRLGDAAYDLDSVLDNLDRSGKLYDKDGKMALAPFGTMVDRSYPSVRRDVKDKVARRLRDAFAEMFEPHRAAVKQKNTASYGHLTEQRSRQAKENLVDREGKKVRAAVRSYADAHPGSALAEWHDWFNGAKDSAEAIDAFFDEERFDDAAMQELANNSPEIGIAKDANGNVDATQFEKTAKRLKDELAKAMQEAEAGAVEEDVERDAPAAEGWERVRDTRPSWWGKEPWDLTDDEERDQEEYFRQKDEADVETSREAEEFGLSPDEMRDGTRVMWRTGGMDPESKKIWDAYHDKDGKPKPGWLKAPNGKPTNLSEEQWMMVRTPSFKKWFGDWEDVANAEAILSEESISSDGELLKLSGKVQRDAAKLIYDELKNGDGVVTKDGRKVRFYSRGFKEIKSHSADPHTLAIVQIIGDVISSAHYISEGDVTNEPKDKDVKAYHIYARKVNLGDGDMIARIVIREDKNGNQFYDEESTSFEQIKEIYDHGVREPNTGSDRKSPYAPHSLAEYFSSVNPANVSKVVDENGEPKVVYHGTSEFGFTKFDFGKAGKRSFDAYKVPGMFFSDNFFAAQSYTENTFKDVNPDPVSSDRYFYWNEPTDEDDAYDYLSHIVDKKNGGEKIQEKLRSYSDGASEILDFARKEWSIRHSDFDKYRDEFFEKTNGVYAVFLDIKNPRIGSSDGGTWGHVRDISEGENAGEIGHKEFVKDAIASGHDGVVINDVVDYGSPPIGGFKPSTDYIAFNSAQIKSADPVTYDDAGNVIPLSERFNPDKTDIRWRTSGIYTGSAADYDKPSLQYIGTGEGSQVYGWGLYGSNKRGVAESYATVEADEKGTLYNTRTGEVRAKKGDWDFAYDKGVLDLQGNVRKEAAEHGWVRSTKGNIYEQTFFTNRAPGDESHLLNWYEPVSKENFSRVVSSLNAAGLYDKMSPFDDFSTFKAKDGARFIEKSNGAVDVRMQDGRPFMTISKKSMNGKALYSALSAALGSPKAASEFLARADIDGIKYPVDSYGKQVKNGEDAGWDYVSFRDDNIDVDHKWVDGVQQWRRSYTPDPALRTLADSFGLTPDEARAFFGGLAVSVGRNRMGGTMPSAESALVGAVTDSAANTAQNLYRELTSPGARSKWNAMLDVVRRKLTDYMLPVKRMEELVVRLTGKVVSVEDSVHDNAKFAFSHQANMLANVRSNFLDPIKKEIAEQKLNEKSPRTKDMTVLHELLLALHGPSFNRMISERTDGANPDGSGASTKYWLDALRDYGAMGTDAQLLAALDAGDYSALRFKSGSVGARAAKAVAKVREMNAFTRNLLVKSGRLSAAQAKLWEKESPFYVPMRFNMDSDQNFMETFFYGKDAKEALFTKGYGPGEFKHAFGHANLADDPLAFSVQQCETAILRATDNDVRRKLAKLVRANQFLGEVVAYLPQADVDDYKKRVAIIDNKIKNGTATAGERAARDRMAQRLSEDAKARVYIPMQPALGANGKQHMVPDVNGAEQKHAHVVAFKEDGELKFIVLGTASKQNGLDRTDDKNLSQRDAELVGRAVKKQALVEPGNMVRFVRKFTRWFGILRTSASPEFLVSNFLADNGQAARNLYADFGWKAVADFERFVPRAWAAARRMQAGNPGTSKLDAYLKEMSENGGLIGGMATENFRDIEKEIERDVAIMQGDKAATLTDWLFKLGEKLNGPVEQATRLAAYAAVRERGGSVAQAAKYAREVTVDFNQKGEWSPVLNALYAFSNASLVDMERSMGAFAAKRGGRMAIQLFLLGFIGSMFGFWQDDPDDEREGKAQWKDTKDYRKQNQIGVRVGDAFWSVPVRGLSRIPHYAGHMAYEVIRGNETAAGAAAKLVGFTAENAFDPIGSAPTWQQTVTPSVARPLVEAMQNKSFAGSQIYRQPMDDHQVRANMGRTTTPGFWRGAAQVLNRLSGGNDVRRGALDIQPELLQHYFSWLAGSAGNDAARLLNIVSDVATSDYSDLNVAADAKNMRNIPFLRRFGAGIDDNSARYGDAETEYKTARKEMDEYADDRAMVKDVIDSHPYFADKRWTQEVDDLVKARGKLMKEEMTATGDDKRAIHELRMKVQAAFLRRIENAPAGDTPDQRAFDRDRSRVVDRFLSQRKRDQKQEKKERERELRRNRILK